MADISKIQIESGTYNIKDTTARSNISTINNTITNIQNTIDNITTEMVVFGDSWSDLNVTEAIWSTIASNNLRLNLHNYAVDGAGYVAPGTNLIRTQFVAAGNDSTYDKDAVRYVVFEGGLNDYRNNVSVNDLKNAIIGLINDAHTLFPNAKIIYVNNFQYPYNSVQSTFWHTLQYNLSGWGIDTLNQDGYYSQYFFISNKTHLTQTGQRVFATNIVAALSGGQIKNEGVFIDFVDNKGYMYIRKEDDLLNYYIYMTDVGSNLDLFIYPNQDLCWETVFARTVLGNVNLSYKMGLVLFDTTNHRLRLARQDGTNTPIAFNGSISLNVRID